MTRSADSEHPPGRQALLGIDLGTSSVKVVVTDLGGAPIGQAVGRYSVIQPRPGWSETDPRAWLSATVTAVQAALAQARATLDLPLGAVDVSGASALGAAALAARVAGTTVRASDRAPKLVAEPDSDRGALYGNRYRHYREMVRAVRDQRSPGSGQ